jgi:hypothetical protein
MFAADLLPATERDDPARLRVRLNWYRSLPLSCVEAIELTVDGRRVEDLAIRVNGYEGPVEDLPADVWWPVLEDAELLGDIGFGALDLAMTLRIPYYGPLPDGSFVTITDRVTA